MVAIGYREPYHWDTKSNNSPVADMSSVRILLYEAGNCNDVLSSVDISVAFLQAKEYTDEDRPRYVSYKPHPNAKVQYYRLKGPIYGMRSASREWYDTLSEWLESEGYHKQHNEPCLFVNNKGFKVLTYVDDLICKGSKEETDRFYTLLNDKFDCKDETYLSPEDKLSFLGFDISCVDYYPDCISGNNYNINHDGKVRVISVDQNDAVESYLNSRDVKPVYSMSSPMSNNKMLRDDTPITDEDEIKLYQSDIGVCTFFSITTRYDIAYATSKLGQYSAKPTVGARKALNKMLSYLRNNHTFSIQGIFAPKHDITSYYSDSDHAGSMPYHSHSHTGNMLLLNDVPIFWKSKKQPVTARSSAEAEVYALDSAVSNARYINWKREEFKSNVTWPMVVYVDNNQAELFCKNLNVTSKLRTTFNMKHNWINELRDKNVVKVEHVNSDVNPADLLTKPHDAGKFVRLLALCNPINIIS